MRAALSFLTILGPSATPDARTLRSFPFVGAMLGVALWGTWEAVAAVSTPGVAAVVVVIADLVLTGMLHIDGVADSADGVLSHLSPERRLEVMRSPDVGAFALAVVPTVILARWVALASTDVDGLALVAVWTMSRTVMAVIPAIVPYARGGGLVTPFLDGSRRWFAIALVPPVVVLVARHHLVGAVAAAGLLAGAALVVETSRRRLGGFTGDVLGAGAVIGETVAILVLATP